MTTAILRELDGSLGVVIPSPLLEALGLKAGASLEIHTDGRRIVLRPAGCARPTYTLAQLLDGLAPDEPLPTDEAWERARPVGNEAIDAGWVITACFPVESEGENSMGDIPVARAYLQEHAAERAERILDLLEVWAAQARSPDLKRQGRMALFGLGGG